MSRDSFVGRLRLVGLLAAGVLPMTAGAATTMVARHSGKCVDVPGATSSAGVGLQQWVCNGTVAQSFSFNATSDGFYRIVPGTHSGLCLQAGASGTQVTQAACSTTSNAQKWSVSQGSDGAYQVKTQGGTTCLNLAGANSNDGAQLITWACGADANMKFDLPGFTPPLPYSGKTTTLVASHSNKCVDVPAASTAPGVGLNQWDCVAGSPEQSFQFVGTSDGFYQIKPSYTNLCLDSGSAANGTIVRQQTCGSATSQKWKVQQKSNGTFNITTANGASCLDIARISSDNGAEVTVWQCVDGANQAFQASGLGGVTPPPPGGDPNNPPATVTPNGNFQLYAGRIYDPNGRMFTPKGANIWPDQAYSFDNLVNCWKVNTVRVNHVYFDYGGWYNQWSLENTLNTFANQGIVAMVEWHEIGHIGDETSGWNHVGVWPYASGQAHTDAIKAFFVDLAQKYKNNPYVWFNLINEQGGPPYNDGHYGDPAHSTVPRWVNVNRQIIQAIRATGAQNMIVIDGMTWGQDSRDGSGDRVTEYDSAILRGGPQVMTNANGQPFGNVLFAVHTYDAWRVNPGPRLEQFFRDVRAKGMVPLVGEYNAYNWNVAQAMVSAAHNLGVGRLVWHHNSGDTQLTTTGGRTGQDINSCTNPTNLNALGRLVWDDFHR